MNSSVTDSEFLGMYTMAQSASESNMAVTLVAPRAGTLKNLFVRIGTATAAGKNWKLTVRLNGVDTALTCTLEAVTTCSNTASTVAVTQGQTITARVSRTGSSPAPANTDWRFSMEFA